jgi:hypothetical protein
LCGSKLNVKRAASNKVENLTTASKSKKDVGKSKTVQSGAGNTRRSIKVNGRTPLRKPPAVENLKEDSLFDSDVESTNSGSVKSSESELEVLKIVKRTGQQKKKVSSKQDETSIASVAYSPSRNSTTTPVRNAQSKKSGGDKPITTFSITTPIRNIGTGTTQNTAAVTPNLASLGISPARTLPFAAQSRASSTRDCLIKVAIIKGLNNSAVIVMRCAPIVTMPNASNICWPEKVFVDALKNDDVWTRQHSICRETHQWYHENQQMKNNKGYAIRLFTMFADNVPTNSSVISFCESVCRCINSSHGNTSTISVMPHNLFWLPNDSVWSDIVGAQKSVELIVGEKGEPEHGFYEENEELILTHFHYKTLNVDLANYFYAPDSALHSSIVAERNSNDDIVSDVEIQELKGEEDDGLSTSVDLLV